MKRLLLKLNRSSQFDNRGWYIFPVLALQLTLAIVVNSFAWPWLILLALLVLTVWQNQRYLVFLEMLLLIGVGFYLGQKPQLTLPHNKEIIVYPDQIKQKPGWISGTGTLSNGQKVLFGSSITKKKNIPAQVLKIKGDWQWQRIAPATNQGEFDFRKYYQQQNIYYRATASQMTITPMLSRKTLLDYLHLLRYCWFRSFQQLPHWLRINACSLLLGDFDTSEVDLRAGLTNLGIIHIFSISGLHVYLLVRILIKLTSFLRIPEESVQLVLFFLLPMFAVIAGSGVGVWRACGLQMVQIIQSHFHWPISRHDRFALVLLGQTLFEPYVLFSLAGQLSYLLSYGLIVIRVNKAWQRSLLINFLSAPVLIFHTYSFVWLTFAANIFLTPLFEHLIIPLTFLSLLIKKSTKLLQILESFFDIIYAPVTALADCHKTQLIVGHLPVMVAMIFVIITLIAVSNSSHSKYWYTLLLLGYCLVMMGNHFPSTGQVTLIDIGQGDSILLTTPFRRKTCLIDTGGKLRFGRYHSSSNRVEQITIPYLKYQGIDHLDYVFLSHQDADHIGDLQVLLKKFPVRRVCFADGMQNNAAVNRQLNPFRKKVQFYRLHLNDEIAVTPQFKIKVLWPRHLSTGTNEDSLSLLVKIQNIKWLFTGDLNQANELKLFKQPCSIDFFKAGHHGSKTASNPQFLKMIQPKLVLISAGRHNRYGHPSPETMATLKKLQIKALSTAEHGMLTWRYSNWHKPQWQLFSKEKIK